MKGTIKLQGKDYATYKLVLEVAHEKGIEAIHTEMVQMPTQDNNGLCVIKATVIMPDGKSFEAYGDASPKNVNKMIAPHLIRMAETRAKGRALRDAVNIGLTLKEELDY